MRLRSTLRGPRQTGSSRKKNRTDGLIFFSLRQRERGAPARLASDGWFETRADTHTHTHTNTNTHTQTESTPSWTAHQTAAGWPAAGANPMGEGEKKGDEGGDGGWVRRGEMGGGGGREVWARRTKQRAVSPFQIEQVSCWKLVQDCSPQWLVCDACAPLDDQPCLYCDTMRTHACTHVGTGRVARCM